MLNRRHFLNDSTRGLGITALWSLLRSENVFAAESDGLALKPHFPAKAKRVVQISLVGGMSHIDSFDYKPNLEKFHGKTLDTDSKPDVFFGQVGLIRKQDWPFRRRGENGMWISEMFPQIAELADDLTLIRSMVSDSANHTPALFFENSGFGFNGYPSMGSWLSYGLGNASESLPTFVVLPDGRGGPNGGSTNWSSGFLPAEHQGVVFRGGKQPVRDLFSNSKNSRETEIDLRSFLKHLNEKHRDRIGGDRLLQARIRSYELAAKMQLSVPKVSELSGETKQTLEMYGFNRKATADCARRCLLARRLLEQGVRFVQIYSGGPIGGSPRASWDAHENVKQNHTVEAKRIDQPVAALVSDLKRRGMLDDTLVLFTTEFGRTPFAQSAANKIGTGRDHNRYAFSVWMAGAGLKRGMSFGSSDDIGWKVAENPVTWHDFHATALHLLGIHHTKLTFYHNGIERRLTNVHGNVIESLIA